MICLKKYVYNSYSLSRKFLLSTFYHNYGKKHRADGVCYFFEKDRVYYINDMSYFAREEIYKEMISERNKDFNLDEI